MTSDYKTSKEAFVSGMTGSSIGHINVITLSTLSSVALYCALRTRIPFGKSYQFATEFSVLVLPLLLSVTLFADTPGVFSICMLVGSGLLLLLPRLQTGIPLPSSLHPSRPSSPQRKHGTDPSQENEASQVAPVAPLPALTTYRAQMLLLTFLCILAVDFPVFPRSLAKCETFGASLMDTGVGCFVFSQGIVSAIPLIKNPSYLTEPMIPKIAVVARKCAPLVVLGVLRTLSVKGVEYPEHLSEYGAHWNFFLTIAFIPILQVLLHPLMLRLPISLLGVLVALFQQLLLSAGLMQYVLAAPRVSLLSANKEGLVSLIGYLAIHLLGVSTGTLVLPPSPSYFRRRQQQLHANVNRKAHYSSDSDSDSDAVSADRARRTRVPYTRENDKTAIELASYAVVYWAVLAAAKLLGVGGGISRRLVNLQYIVWVAAYNSSFLLGTLLLDLLFFPSPLSQSTYSPTSKLKVHPDAHLLDTRVRQRGPAETPPALFDAVNRNGLVLFLLANVATGLVNLSMPTMFMADWAAMLVLSVYMVGICYIAWMFKDKKLYKL